MTRTLPLFDYFLILKDLGRNRLFAPHIAPHIIHYTNIQYDQNLNSCINFDHKAVYTTILYISWGAIIAPQNYCAPYCAPSISYCFYYLYYSLGCKGSNNIEKLLSSYIKKI